MRRALLAAAAIAVAVVVQVTVLNRLPFPGGSGPDLVLVLVVTIGLAGGPLPGALAGFAAGLALDLAPPGTSMLGLSALVFCLVGYGSGRLRAPLERSALLPLSGVAAGVAAGEVGYALVGMIFGDPDFTWQSVRRLLPPSVLYDLLLSPFVLYAVVRLGRFGAGAPGHARYGLLTGRELAGTGLAGAAVPVSGNAVRDSGSGRSPRLRAAARRADGWIGGHHGQGGPAGVWVPRRRPIRLRGGVAGSAAAVPARPPARPASPVHVHFGAPRRRDGTVNSASHGQAARGRGPATGAAGLSASAFRGSPSALSRAGRDRPSPAPHLRAAAFRGSPSALSRAGRDRPSPAPHLRLRKSRRRDGLVGGGVLGTGGTLSPAGTRRGLSGAVFRARRSRAAGALRPGRGRGATPRRRATPRFRIAGRGLSGWMAGRPGRAGRGGGAGALAGRRGWLRTRRGWSGVRRGWLRTRRGWPRGRWGAVGVRRGWPGVRRGWLRTRRGWPGVRHGWLRGRRWRWVSRSTRRWPVWKAGSKRTGGLP